MATAIELHTDTFDTLHARLGHVPLNRIRTHPAPGTATEEDLERAPKPICELIDGVLVEKAIGNAESSLAGYISHLLWTHFEGKPPGVILGEAGHFRLAGQQLRAPDVSFTPWSSFPMAEPPKESYWSVAPALIVEVLSPNNTRAEMDRKLNEFFDVGIQLAWVINPATKSVKVYTSVKKFKEIGESGTLDGGEVISGFKLLLADLFKATNPPKAKPK